MFKWYFFCNIELFLFIYKTRRPVEKNAINLIFHRYVSSSKTKIVLHAILTQVCNLCSISSIPAIDRQRQVVTMSSFCVNIL